MTPRVAAFFWCGSPVPWLRWQSPISFKRWHPDWDVVLYTDDASATPVDGVRVEPIQRPACIRRKLWDGALPATKSDVWRWDCLHRVGGLYVDTDVLFFGSFEPIVAGLDEAGFHCGLTMDSGTIFRHLGLKVSIGMVSSHPGCPFFSRLASIVSDCELVGDQSAGTVAVGMNWERLKGGVMVGNIPGKLLYPFGGRSTERDKVWSPSHEIPGDCLALHWHGGSKNKGHRSLFTGEAWREATDCPVKSALVMSEATQA